MGVNLHQLQEQPIALESTKLKTNQTNNKKIVFFSAYKFTVVEYLESRKNCLYFANDAN